MLSFVHNTGAGGCFQGEVLTTYDKLVSVFGKPTFGKGDKVNVEWRLLFSDGTQASIYDWKEDTIPLGPHEWHIGGVNKESVNRVREVLETVQ